MGYFPYKGATLLIPYNDVPHLFVVLNDPCPDGLCLLVMVTSIKKGRKHDDACLLEVGDHEFINHPSYVLYRLAMQTSAAHIGNMVDKKYYGTKQDASDVLYKRVVDGLFSSDDTKRAMIRYANSVGL